MKNFKDFGIRPTAQSMEGDKIKIQKILNLPITVLDFRVEDSKYGNGSAKCLYMQIELNGDKRVVFSGSAVLMEIIQRVPKTDFPFITTIVKENERLVFT